jgi:DNA polymerase-4
MPRYRTASQVLRACLRRHVARLEPDDLGSAYLDPGGIRESLAALAARICDAVATDLRLPLRIGIAGTRLSSRLAAEEAGDAGVFEVPSGGEAAFLAGLAVTRLPGVGPSTAAKLEAIGARRIGDLKAAGRSRLEELLGNRGLELLELAEGQGAAMVHGEQHPRSLSLETTLPGPETDPAALGATLTELAARLESMLALNGLAARRLTLKVRFEDGETTTRSVTLAHGISAAADLESQARALLGRAPAGSRATRLLGLSVTQFSRVRRNERQLDLFGNPVRG